MAQCNRKITRPFWQTRACPSWCSRHHRDYEDGPDRMHMSRWSARVIPTLLDGVALPSDPLDVEPVMLAVYLEMGYREIEPTVRIGQLAGEPGGSMVELPLTLAEAERLARHLTKAVRLAKKEADQ